MYLPDALDDISVADFATKVLRVPNLFIGFFLLDSDEPRFVMSQLSDPHIDARRTKAVDTVIVISVMFEPQHYEPMHTHYFKNTLSDNTARLMRNQIDFDLESFVEPELAEAVSAVRAQSLGVVVAMLFESGVQWAFSEENDFVSHSITTAGA